MKNKDKIKRSYRISGIAGLLIVVIHFSLVITYCFPDQKFPESMRMVSNEYCVPFFHQGYMLFAPDPPAYHGMLHVNCMKNGELTVLEPAVSKVLPDHFRLPRTADRLIIEMMADMRKNLYFEDDSLNYSVVGHGRGFLALVYMSATQFEQEHGSKPDSIRFKLDLVMIPESSDSLPKVQPYNFPWYAIKD